MKKKRINVFMIIENGKPVMMIKRQDRIYKEVLNPASNPNAQVMRFIESVNEAEELLLMRQSDSFYDYMFTKMTRKDYDE